jgi:hypothetical protein
MPRRSSTARHFPVHSSERLRPPAELTTAEKKIFVDIVSNSKPTHFIATDLPLLVCYCHAVVMENQLARQVAKDGELLPKWERAAKSLVALSMRLRLSPQSRTPTHAGARSSDANRAPLQPANYFERMALQNGGDDAHDQ